MPLPYVVLHNAVSIDGRIDGFPVDLGLFYGVTERWNEDAILPGEVTIVPGEITLNAGRREVSLVVTNTGDRPIQVGSHFPFEETNRALDFDRAAAANMRLDIPAGAAVRFEPGESKTVRLIATSEGAWRTSPSDERAELLANAVPQAGGPEQGASS